MEKNNTPIGDETFINAVRQACSTVECFYDFNYVSHRALGRTLLPDEPKYRQMIKNGNTHVCVFEELDEKGIWDPDRRERFNNNFVMYLDGLPKRSGADRWRARLGRAKKGDYAEARIRLKAMMAYIWSRNDFSRDVPVYLTSVLDRFFPATDCAEGEMMTAEETDAVLNEIRVEEYEWKGYRLLRKLEDLPEHKGLFERLQTADLGDGKGADLEKALIGFPGDFGEGDFSLRIAQCLYRAYKEHKAVEEKIKCLDIQRKNGQNDSDGISSGAARKLVELAVRLGDIRNGRYMQGFSEESGRMDEIIYWFLSQKKEKRKAFPVLEPLFALMENCEFESIRVSADPAKNCHYANAERNRAITKLKVYALLGFSAVLGSSAAAAGVVESRRQERMEEISGYLQKDMEERIKRLEFRGDGSYTLKEDEKVSTFNRMVDSTTAMILERYETKSIDEVELKAMVSEFMLKHEHLIPLDTVRDYRLQIAYIADRFFIEKKLFLRRRGVESNFPYENDLVRDYRQEILKLSQMPDLADRITREEMSLFREEDSVKFHFDEGCTDAVPIQWVLNRGREIESGLYPITIFREEGEGGDEYELYVRHTGEEWTKCKPYPKRLPPRSYFYATKNAHKPRERFSSSEPEALSLITGQEAARALVELYRGFNRTQLGPYFNVLKGLSGEPDLQVAENDLPPGAKIIRPADFWGRPGYEFAAYPKGYPFDHTNPNYHLLAKKDGEKTYSVEIAREALDNLGF